MSPHRYLTADEDSGRWEGFPFRHGDIVISTRSKSGTTWMQMICALLVFRTPHLSERLSDLSPWLDWLLEPRSHVMERLEAQDHGRIIKTHTPLDGLPLDDRASYIVVGRRPIDMAVSLYHQGDNLNRDLIERLSGQVDRSRANVSHTLSEWIDEWMAWDGDPRQRLDSMSGVIHHFADAWERRNNPNIVLVHYDDLSRNLEGEMRRLARLLGIEVPEAQWSSLVEAATFENMRSNADNLAPGPVGVLKSSRAFFRNGPTVRAENVLSTDQIDRYSKRIAELTTPALLSWIDPRAAQ